MRLSDYIKKLRVVKLTRGWVKGLIAVGVSLAVLSAIVGGYAIWLSFPQRATEAELQRAEQAVGVNFRETSRAIVVAPPEFKTAILMYPGARVEAKAYAYKMTAIAQRGIAVVIVKPFLNFAILDMVNVSDYKKELPNVQDWYIAGHSLGGVKACGEAAAKPEEYDGLVLFGSYCNANIAQVDLKVLSIGGENDALSTPTEIDANKSLLPAGASFVTIAGMNHASFGDYGVQDGDGAMTANNDQVRQEIAAAVANFIGVE